MSVGANELRLVAALAHSAGDADVELVGKGRRWLVSYQRSCATIDPCGFRQLVLATVRGCRVGILPVDRVRFVGGLREIGGGVFHGGGHGVERRLATLLPAPRVEELLADGDPEPGDGMSARIHGDEELGATVVTLATSRRTCDLRLDALAYRLAAACLVNELIDATVQEATK